MKMKSFHSFSRSESEIETTRDREREVKMKKNSREFSRNENLAGLCLEDQLEAAPDLLLADGGHGNDLFERPWYPLLSASDVKTSSSDGIIGTALQAFPKKRSSSLCNMTNVILMPTKQSRRLLWNWGFGIKKDKTGALWWDLNRP